MRRRFASWLLTSLLASAAAAWSNPATRIEPPAGAFLVGKSEVTELRAFPEMAATAEGRAHVAAHGGPTHASDAVYQSPMSYDETVRFFDQQLAKKQLRVVARTVTETATAWTIERGDATIANVIVRTTTPRTTFEIAQLEAG
jgi:hypothetical protein